MLFLLEEAYVLNLKLRRNRNREVYYLKTHNFVLKDSKVCRGRNILWRNELYGDFAVVVRLVVVVKGKARITIPSIGSLIAPQNHPSTSSQESCHIPPAIHSLLPPITPSANFLNLESSRERKKETLQGAVVLHMEKNFSKTRHSFLLLNSSR